MGRPERIEGDTRRKDFSPRRAAATQSGGLVVFRLAPPIALATSGSRRGGAFRRRLHGPTRPRSLNLRVGGVKACRQTGSGNADPGADGQPCTRSRLAFAEGEFVSPHRVLPEVPGKRNGGSFLHAGRCPGKITSHNQPSAGVKQSARAGAAVTPAFVRSRAPTESIPLPGMTTANPVGKSSCLPSVLGPVGCRPMVRSDRKGRRAEDRGNKQLFWRLVFVGVFFVVFFFPDGNQANGKFPCCP